MPAVGRRVHLAGWLLAQNTARRTDRQTDRGKQKQAHAAPMTSSFAEADDDAHGIPRPACQQVLWAARPIGRVATPTQANQPGYGPARQWRE